MSDLERQVSVAREQAELVTRRSARLAALGASRRRALGRAARELGSIGDELPGALAAGLSMSQIERLTGVSRPTLYALRSRSVASQ